MQMSVLIGHLNIGQTFVNKSKQKQNEQLIILR